MTEWIKKKDPMAGEMDESNRKSKWITKKAEPKSWITKKEKPTAWITKKPEKEKPKWITKKKKFMTGYGSKGKSKMPVSVKSRAGFRGGGRTNLLEELGRVEGEHSNRNRRAEVSRIHGELNRGYKKGGRAKHAVGGVIKAGKRFLDFIKTGKRVDKHGVKVNVPKAAERITGKPHVDHGIKKRNKESKKAFKSAKGKASGGRIGLKHGSSAQSHYLQHGYGPTKTRLRTGKPKIAIKGWS